MASDKEITFLCTECGDSFAKWSGKCPSCGTWGTLKEFREPAVNKKGGVKKSEKGAKPVPLSSCRDTSEERIVSGIEEFDNVLGGGIVKASAVLVGGSPGIGKSTLMLQCAANLSEKEGNVLYISGEESPSQVQARAERLGYGSASIDILDSPVIKDILKALTEKEYD
ncbi:MAG: ATPase domain-containing protein, partial [Chitinivibrionales bacterium]